jgi:hypothetical protein
MLQTLVSAYLHTLLLVFVRSDSVDNKNGSKLLTLEWGQERACILKTSHFLARPPTLNQNHSTPLY